MVHAEETFDFGVEVVHPHGANLHVGPSLQAREYALLALTQRVLLLVEGPTPQVHGLLPPGVDPEVLVVPRVLGSEDHRRVLEALDQQAALVVGGERRRSDALLDALGVRPPAGGVEQGGGRLGVVEGLEEPDPRPRLVLELVELVVDARADATDGLAVPVGHPQRRVLVVVGRVFRRDAVEHRDAQRWHPRGVVLEEPEREVDEPVPRHPAPDRFDLNRHDREARQAQGRLGIAGPVQRKCTGGGQTCDPR